MRIVTSISPNRMDRQKICIESWRRRDVEVIAVQPRGDTAFAPQFPDVQIVETDLVGDLFGKRHCVRISAMAALAVDSPVIILNSDIELKMSRENFHIEWDRCPERVLQVGLRWDRHPRFRQARLFKWGIDAFLITPEIARDMTDIGMALGCPGWDYWIPWHLHTLGYNFRVLSAYEMEHVMHKQQWKSSESKICYELMAERYGVAPKDLVAFIQKSTCREGLRAWRPII